MSGLLAGTDEGSSWLCSRAQRLRNYVQYPTNPPQQRNRIVVRRAKTAALPIRRAKRALWRVLSFTLTVLSAASTTAVGSGSEREFRCEVLGDASSRERLAGSQYRIRHPARKRFRVP